LTPATDAVPDIWAWAAAPAATHINVAVSTDLMRSLGSIEERAIKHICLVANNRRTVQPNDGQTEGYDLKMLSADELERYARHIVLREVGGPGQAALKEAAVLVIGAGGLGAPALMYLAAAGVGTLGVVDDDVVSLSNLQRQIIHATPDIGRRKVDTAAERIYALNPHVGFAAHATRLDVDNAMSLIGGYDLVLDGSDNFETRYLVSDACFLAGKPLITAALGMFDGSLTTIRAHEKDADGQFNPTYRCLFPEPPPPGTVPACAEAGVMGALAGVLGSMMALEAIREIVGFGEGLVGRLLMVDARAMRFETLRYKRDPLNPLNGDALVITDLSGHR
jgi:adenylyltransferase/sulfurtransferase